MHAEIKVRLVKIETRCWRLPSDKKLWRPQGVAKAMIVRSTVSSGRADGVEEFPDLYLETVAVARQHLRRRQHLRGSGAGLGSAALHVGDVRRDLLGALSCLLHVAGNLLGRRALLFHRGCDGRGDLRELFDGAADLLD